MHTYIHISPCYRSNECRRRHWQYIRLGLASHNQGTSDKADKAQDSSTKGPAPAQSQSIVGICPNSHLQQPGSHAEPCPREPLFAITTHHSTTRLCHARARHYHQLDRCHRRRQKTIVHHRPTLTSSLSVCLSRHSTLLPELANVAAPELLPPDRLHSSDSARRGRQRPPGTQGIGDTGQHDPDLALGAIRRDVIDYSPCDSGGASSSTHPQTAREHPSA